MVTKYHTNRMLVRITLITRRQRRFHRTGLRPPGAMLLKTCPTRLPPTRITRITRVSRHNSLHRHNCTCLSPIWVSIFVNMFIFFYTLKKKGKHCKFVDYNRLYWFENRDHNCVYIFDSFSDCWQIILSMEGVFLRTFRVNKKYYLYIKESNQLFSLS